MMWSDRLLAFLSDDEALARLFRQVDVDKGGNISAQELEEFIAEQASSINIHYC